MNKDKKFNAKMDQSIKRGLKDLSEGNKFSLGAVYKILFCKKKKEEKYV